MSRIYSPALIFSAMSAASPESLVLTMVCPFITVTWSPLTVATIGSELSFAAGVFFEGCPSGMGILPISAVAPAATAATPTPNFRNSLRETFLFWLFSDSFSTLSSDVNRFRAVLVYNRTKRFFQISPDSFHIALGDRYWLLKISRTALYFQRTLRQV